MTPATTSRLRTSLLTWPSARQSSSTSAVAQSSRTPSTPGWQECASTTRWSGSSWAATMASQPPSGPWASCSISWCAGTFLSKPERTSSRASSTSRPRCLTVGMCLQGTGARMGLGVGSWHISILLLQLGRRLISVLSRRRRHMCLCAAQLQKGRWMGSFGCSSEHSSVAWAPWNLESRGFCFLSAECHHLLKWCLCMDPADRPCLEDPVEHSWLQKSHLAQETAQVHLCTVGSRSPASTSCSRFMVLREISRVFPCGRDAEQRAWAQEMLPQVPGE